MKAVVATHRPRRVDGYRTPVDTGEAVDVPLYLEGHSGGKMPCAIPSKERSAHESPGVYDDLVAGREPDAAADLRQEAHRRIATRLGHDLGRMGIDEPHVFLLLTSTPESDLGGFIRDPWQRHYSCTEEGSVRDLQMLAVHGTAPSARPTFENRVGACSFPGVRWPTGAPAGADIRGSSAPLREPPDYVIKHVPYRPERSRLDETGMALPDLTVKASEGAIVLLQVKNCDPVGLEPVTAPGISRYVPRGRPALDRILRQYECTDRASVEGFLRARPEVVDLLRQVPDRAREFFDCDVAVGLDVVEDGEYFLDPELFVYVRAPLPPGDAWERFRRMEMEWWVDKVQDPSVNLDVRCG